MWRNLWNDVRYAARSLNRSRGFAAAAIVTIALGVGVNTGIFAVLNGVLFRNLPAADAHELVSIYQTIEGVPERESAIAFGLFSTTEYRAYRERAQTLSGIMGHSDPWEATLGGAAPQEALGLLVTCGYFDVLRAAPAIGRGLRAADCETGASPVVVLGHDLWTTSFGADPAVLGRTIELNRQLLTVVGVAQAGTYGGFLYDAEFFAPISAQPYLLPDANIYANETLGWLALIGRRAASLDQVRAELGVIAAQMDAQQPDRATRLTIERATPLSVPVIRGMAVGAGAVVMTAFGLILLIACANTANLLLARATTRTRDIAVRLALGASRARVLQQLLAESALLSIVGAALGAVVALWSFQALVGLALPSFSPAGAPPLVLDTSPDGRVLAFTLALTFGTGIAFGLPPALRVSKTHLHAVIKRGSSGAGNRGGRLRAVLVGVQAALCMVLMIGTGLLLRGLHATQTIDPGFAYRDVVYASYDLRGAGYDPEDAAAFAQRVIAEVAALPGVQATAYAAREPLGDDIVFAMARLPSADETAAHRAELNWVTPDYFSLVEIPIVRGRSFTAAELTSDAPVAIVTAATARNFWPGQDPIGQALVVRMLPAREIAVQIVGVGADAQVRALGAIDPYYVYLPAAQFQEVLLVKSRTDFAATVSGIRAVVRALDPNVAVRVNPLEANLDWWRNLSGKVTALAASLGALALVLAAVGIYGVVSYFVGRRTREIGIRMALGAGSRSVLGLILRQTMRPVAVGAVIGIAAGVGASRILSSVLFGVSPVDPIGLGAAVLFVLGVALAAGVLAGRRGTRVDPMTTLRHE